MLDEYIKSKINKAYEFMQNDTTHALRIFNEILEIEPENIDALNGKGSALIKLNKFSEAEKYTDKSLSICENSSALINKAIICKNTQKYQKALCYFDKAIEIKPELNTILTILKNEILEQCNKKSLNLNKFTTQANNYIKKGLDYKKENKLWDAWDCFELAIESDHTAKNAVLILISEIKEILQKEFVFETPQFNESKLDNLKLQSLKTLLIEEDPKKALTLMNLILDIDENDLDTLNHKGCLLFLFDEYDNSKKCFDKCLEIKEDYCYALFNKAIVMRKMNKLNEALEYFEELSKITKYRNKVKAYKMEILGKLETN